MIDEHDDKTLDLFETYAQATKREIDEASEKIEALQYFVRIKTDILRNQICTHDTLVETSTYFLGGYLDTDYTEYYYRCELCGKLLDTKRYSHGSYG